MLDAYSNIHGPDNKDVAMDDVFRDVVKNTYKHMNKVVSDAEIDSIINNNTFIVKIIEKEIKKAIDHEYKKYGGLGSYSGWIVFTRKNIIKCATESSLYIIKDFNLKI
jgi:hypothetical protein